MPRNKMECSFYTRNKSLNLTLEDSAFYIIIKKRELFGRGLPTKTKGESVFLEIKHRGILRTRD